MPNAFETLMQEARDAGVDPQWIERVEQASAGSPLRKEKDQLAEQLKSATEQANRYRGAALNTQFTNLGIKVKPDALKIPDDLDPLDDEGVRNWAVGMGLAEPAPPAVPTDEQQAHRQLVDASAGAAGTPRHDARQSVLDADTPEEFWARSRAAGFAK